MNKNKLNAGICKKLFTIVILMLLFTFLFSHDEALDRTPRKWIEQWQYHSEFVFAKTLGISVMVATNGEDYSFQCYLERANGSNAFSI